MLLVTVETREELRERDDKCVLATTSTQTAILRG